MSAQPASPPFRNLIRFSDASSVEHYGDVPEGCSLNEILGSTVPTLRGSLYDLKRTGETAFVRKLLSPITETPIFVCIGLNYADHAKEANLQTPPNPVIFMKPADALSGPDLDVSVPAGAKLMDYEGELCIIVSHTGKDIPEKDAMSYILGFTAGNDFSSRYWQRPPYSGGQYCYAKSFDNFAPLGPTILHPSVAGSGASLQIQTRVNGEIRQNASTNDMIFSVEKIISHISRGTTLRQGTVIMTGTPAGIAAKMPGEPWLKDGDVVEVEITNIGRLRNKLVFQAEEKET